MGKWFSRAAKSSGGWLAVSLGPDALEFARGEHVPAPGRSRIEAFGSRTLALGRRGADAARALHAQRYRCSTVLRPGEYQLLLVEAPNVPQTELKSAIRWRIKDMLDYHVDDATLDVLDIPSGDAASGRNPMMYAVAAKNELIRARIDELEAAQVPLSVIDIPETAQRNVAALYETGERAVALVYLGEDWGLLTVNWRAELVLARRLDVGLRELGGAPELAGEGRERLAIEIQRTLDHFERQFREVGLGALLLAPTPGAPELSEDLAGRLGVALKVLDLREVLAFDGEGPDAEAQWRLFHHFGAALRDEAKAL